MRNLTVFVEGGGGEYVYLDESIVGPSTVTVKSATVFWRLENVTENNNSISIDGREVTLTPGYWDFEAIRERLRSENITLTRNIPDRTCNILSKGKPVEMRNLGILLGFEKYDTIPADTQTKSQNPVDIIQGLRYVNVKCDAVDIRKSLDTGGERSTILVSLPIMSYEQLNSSTTNYGNVDKTVSLYSGDISRLSFSLSSNINRWYVGADVLLNLQIE